MYGYLKTKSRKYSLLCFVPLIESYIFEFSIFKLPNNMYVPIQIEKSKLTSRSISCCSSLQCSSALFEFAPLLLSASLQVVSSCGFDQPSRLEVTFDRQKSPEAVYPYLFVPSASFGPYPVRVKHIRSVEKLKLE